MHFAPDLASRQSGSRVRPGARRLGSATIAAALVAGAGSPSAFGLAEAINDICPSGLSGVSCPWYEGGGPVVDQLLADPLIFGETTTLGLIEALFGLAIHEALLDDFGNSRILAEIQAGLIGDGNPQSMIDQEFRDRTTGSLHAAIGDGLPAGLAMGIAPEAKAIVAVVADTTAPNQAFAVNIAGLFRSLLIMNDPVAAAAYALPVPDVIQSNLSSIGDFTGEGDVAYIHDVMADQFGATIVVPSGDGLDPGNPDPNDPEAEFRTLGSPATGYNLIGAAGLQTDPPEGEPSDGDDYIYIFENSGRGRSDAVDFRTIDLDNPSGFAVQEDVRHGISVAAPAAKLRLATAEGEGAYSRDIDFPNDPDDPLQIPGSMGTAHAAGLTAGACLLVQDVYKRLLAEAPEAFPHWAGRPRLPGFVVKALLHASASRSQSWTNQGNQGASSADIEIETTQPLDTVEGAGYLNLVGLFEVFQGVDEDFFQPAQLATMDSELTDPDIPLVRENVAGIQRLRSIFDDIDPPLDGDGDDIGDGSSGPYIPDPFYRPPPGGPSVTLPQNPDTIFIDFAIPVRTIGWDHGRIGAGTLEYEIIEPLSPSGTFTATLVWNRTQRITYSDPTSPAPIVINEVNMELEDLNLELFRSNGSGGSVQELGFSRNQWNTGEHLVFRPAPNGNVIMRVRWNQRRYDIYDNNFVGDTEFAIAWRYQPVGQDDTPNLLVLPGDLNGDLAVTMEDLNIVLSNYGRDVPLYDINGDGTINFFELNLVLANMSQSSVH